MLLAGSSLLTLLDDIATLLDDISVMGKLAAKKTAGVLGDDLSLNAQQVSGVRANRELPVVWGVAKGSLINKVILVPLALIISAFIPWAITPLLMIGGAFLCFEGVEKVLHMLEARKHKEDPAQSQQRLEKLAAQDPLKFEKDKKKGRFVPILYCLRKSSPSRWGLWPKRRCLIRCWCFQASRW